MQTKRLAALVGVWMMAGSLTPGQQPPAGRAGARGAVSTPREPGAPIVAGCELPNCYPAASVPPTLDWTVTVVGPAGSDVVLRFQPTLPGAPKVAVQGGKWLSPSDLQIPVGTVRIGGVPMAGSRVVIVEPLASFARGGDGLAPVTLTVRQTVGGVAVAGYRYTWSEAPRVPVAAIDSDQIVLLTKQDPLPSVLMLDGHRGTAHVNDELRRSPVGGTVRVGNLVPTSQSSEVSAFSVCNGMGITVGPPWTLQPTDKLPMDLPEVVELPVSVVNTRSTPDAAAMEAEIRTDVQRANMIFTSMGVGVRFRVRNIAHQPTDDVSFWCSSGSWSTFMQNHARDAGRVNVYYMNHQSTGCHGAATDPDGANAIVIGTLANTATLAHELSHLLSLSLESGWGPFTFPPTNIMSAGGDDRNCVTIGQAFRMNVSPDSCAITLGGRVIELPNGRTLPKVTRSCPDPTSSDACPTLLLDMPRPFRFWAHAYCGTGTEAWGTNGVDELLTWLQCDDCPIPSLERYGSRMIGVLRAFLESGASNAMSARLRLAINHAFTLMEGYATTCEPDPVRMSRLAFLNTYTPRLNLRLRLQAADALAAIGSPEARAVLVEAQAWSLPDAVRAHVRALLAQPPSPRR